MDSMDERSSNFFFLQARCRSEKLFFLARSRLQTFSPDFFSLDLWEKKFQLGLQPFLFFKKSLFTQPPSLYIHRLPHFQLYYHTHRRTPYSSYTTHLHRITKRTLHLPTTTPIIHLPISTVHPSPSHLTFNHTNQTASTHTHPRISHPSSY